MIKDSFYLSDESNLDRAIDITGLAPDEIELIVGRFKAHSHRAGQLRGEVVEYFDGTIVIRHHFNKKVLTKIEPYE
jgi:hypothetical protein